MTELPTRGTKPSASNEEIDVKRVSVIVLVSALVSATVFACSSTPEPTDSSVDGAAPAVSPEAGSVVEAGPGTPSLRNVIDPAVKAALTEGGVDVDALPSDLKALEPAKLRAVMKSFTIALGTECAFCHEKAGDKLDFTKTTERTAVAARMWKDWVVGLRTKDGAAVFCDSCHQGKTEVLDRGDKTALAKWMKDELVGKLTKADKSALTCETCHGKPFEPSFLSGWKTR